VRFQVLTAARLKITAFALQRHVLCWKITDVSEVIAAFVIRAMITEAASTSETSVNSTILHGTTTQKTVVFSFITYDCGAI
jgi:hypothetical protein